jgi:chorismate mutase
MNFTAGSSLERIRSELIRLEDSIIFALIERAQFALNKPVYSPNSFFEKSFLDLMIDEIEAVHGKLVQIKIAKFRRYTSPDEHPFSNVKLPDPILPPLDFPQILKPNNININGKIKDCYINQILPMITVDHDDGNYGSSATRDIEALQLISRRIHFGKFVAEGR